MELEFNEQHQVKVAGQFHDAAEVIAKGESSGGLFRTISLLSLVNSALSFFQVGIVFPIGLTIMRIADAVLLQARNEIQEPQKLMIFAAVIAVFNLVVAGLFFVFSVFSNRLVKAVFYSGLVLYLLDGVLSFLVGDYVGLGFHGFFLLGLFGASHFITPAIQLKQMADAGRGVLDNQSSWEMPGTADA